ncbi:hypothetical protein B0T17DRAFT_602237 [Bombardia bombarda]|uniref:Uncharacterized protein n=1 Tax=Bombardia bombarda TaxID=252184 RepID=A0AA39WGW4_9PEZI|nr:hypothetical protein B0T17DRAFT_602237 [Bombardia bombarda]
MATALSKMQRKIRVKIQGILGSSPPDSGEAKMAPSAWPTPVTVITERCSSPPPAELEPGPLGRSASTGGCRLPTPDLIAQAWKKQMARQGRECYDVDPSISEQMAADLARPFGQSTGRGFSLTQFRVDVRYQTIIMRGQDVWAPRMGPGHTATLQTLYEIGHILTHADPICRHLQWADEYPFLVPYMASFGLDQHFNDDEAAQITSFLLPRAALNDKTDPLLSNKVYIHKRLQCALFHGMHCMCRDSISYNALKSCPRCLTDYAVTVLPDTVPARPEGRLLVFTTWKFLGNCSRSRSWESHQTSAPPERSYSAGYIHQTFESHPSGKQVYKIDVDEIQQYVTSARESRSREALPEYTAAVAPGSFVIHAEKELT